MRNWLESFGELCEPLRVNEVVPDRLYEPLTRSAMAKRAGISYTTLTNWTKREVDPLPTVETAAGDVLYTWRLLLDFCRAHPKLHSSSQVLDQHRRLLVEESSGRASGHPSIHGATALTGRQETSGGSVSGDGVTLRAALLYLKSEVDAHSSVVAAAAQLAEDAARCQASLLERLELLQSAVAAQPAIPTARDG